MQARAAIQTDGSELLSVWRRPRPASAARSNRSSLPQPSGIAYTRRIGRRPGARSDLASAVAVGVCFRAPRRTGAEPATVAAAGLPRRRRSGHARRDPAHADRSVRARPRQRRVPGVRRRRGPNGHVPGDGARRSGFNVLSPPSTRRARPKASSCRAPSQRPTWPDASSSCSSTICTSRRPRRRWCGRC